MCVCDSNVIIFVASQQEGSGEDRGKVVVKSEADTSSKEAEPPLTPGGASSTLMEAIDMTTAGMKYCIATVYMY